MAKIGRPGVEVTAAIKAEILDTLELGMSLAEAQIMCGVSGSSVKRAQRADSDFDRGLKSAALRGKKYHIQRIAAAVERWQASAWFLERKYGLEFGNRLKLEHEGLLVNRLLIEIAGAAGENNLARVEETNGEVHDALEAARGATPLLPE